MKKIICTLLAILLIALCGGCGEKQSAFQPEQTVQALLDSNAFSEKLEELDPALLFSLEGDDYDGSVLYYSTGATAELATVIVAPDAAGAADVEDTLQTWLDYQLESERSYRPTEAEKLEHAILETRGNTVLLVVAADWEAAADEIDS